MALNDVYMQWGELWDKVQKGHERGKRIQKEASEQGGDKIYPIALVSWVILSPLILVGFAIEPYSDVLPGLLAIIYIALSVYGYYTILGLLK